MVFRFGTQRRNVRQVSRAAEACEPRSLLCAAAISMAAVEIQDTDTVADSVASDETDVIQGEDSLVELKELQNELFYPCVMLPLGDVTGEMVRDSVESEIIDPAICYAASDGFVPDGGEIINSDGDKLPDDFVMYAWDPVALDSTGLDGLGCGVAPDGFVPEGGEIIDSDGDGLPDDFVMYPKDPIADETPVEIDPGVEYPPIRYVFGSQFRGAVADDATGIDEEMPIDIEFSSSENDFEPAVDSISVNPAMLEVTGASGEMPLEAMFYSMSSVGGEELQQTMASAAAQETGNFVLVSVASSIFQAEQFASSLGTMLDSEENSPGTSVIPQSLPVSAVRSGIETAFNSRVATNGNQPEGLDPLVENLSPQLDTGNNTVPDLLSESSAAETGAKDEAVSDADEQPAAPVQVTSAGGPINPSSPELAQGVRREVRVNRAIAEFAIDDFMSEFAQDSFLS